MKTTTTTRIAAVFAAVGVTALLAASQLGLASHYEDQADALLAKSNTTVPATQLATAPARQAG
jgi:lipopolysaccharide export LptBFGC system permease protein LptF